MAEDKVFEYESMHDAESIGELLRSIMEGIEKGRILLKSDEEEVVFHPDGLLKFTIKGKKQERRNKLTLKISWSSSTEGKSVRNILISP